MRRALIGSRDIEHGLGLRNHFACQIETRELELRPQRGRVERGQTDVVLQSPTGSPAVWLMNGTTIASGQYIFNQPLPGWTIRASR